MPSGEDRRRWFRYLVCLAWAWVVIPRAAQSLGAPKSRSYISGVLTYTPLAKTSHTLLTLALFALCLTILVLSARDLQRAHVGILILVLLPWVYQVVRDEYAGQPLHKTTFVYPLVVLAVWALRPRIEDLSVLGYLTGIMALLGMVLGVLLPSAGIYHQNPVSILLEEKQIVPGGILVGVLTSGNNLGQFLIMGFPSIALIKSRVWRSVLGAACVYAIVWAACRSAMGGLVAVIVVALLLRAVPPAARGFVGAAAVASSLAAVVALPVLTENPLAFTNRGFIWQHSLAAWHQDPLFGLGSNWYSLIGSTSQTLGGSVFHGHNQYVHALVIGGVVLAVLLGLVVLLAMRAAARLAKSGSNFGVLYLVAFMAACLLEVSFELVDRDFLLPVMVVPLASILFARQSAPITPATAPAVKPPALAARQKTSS